MNSTSAPKSGKTSFQVIERMSRLLDILANQPEPLSLKTIAKQAEPHPSTAHRALSNLL